MEIVMTTAIVAVSALFIAPLFKTLADSIGVTGFAGDAVASIILGLFVALAMMLLAGVL